MRKLKNILVGLNGSSCSYHALEESIHLAHWARAGITAITVAPPYEGDLSLVGVRDIKATINGPYEDILDEAVEIAEMHSVRMNVIREEGETHEKILHCAEREGSDLIVLGASSHWSLSRAFLGSVTSRMIADSPRDFLAIPEHSVIGWEKILLIADDSEYGRSSVALAIDIAAAYGSELKVVPGENTGQETVDELRTWAKRTGISCTILERCTLYSGTTSNLAREQGVELTILGLETRKGLKKLFMCSLVDRLICSSDCPVLMVRAHHQPGPG